MTAKLVTVLTSRQDLTKTDYKRIRQGKGHCRWSEVTKLQHCLYLGLFVVLVVHVDHVAFGEYDIDYLNAVTVATVTPELINC